MVEKHFSNRAIHLDFHTMPGIYDVGSEFRAEEFAATLKETGVDYITLFARCNLGFAYYPTKIGIIHPSLKIDLLGEMVKACHAKGIKVSAYFNAGIDHEHALRHREWCKVDKKGRVYKFEVKGHGFRNPCLNTGYRDYLLMMVNEVLVKYPVDGIFLDCFDLSPCYGVECLDSMKRLAMNIFDDDEVQRHTQLITENFLEDVKRLVNKKEKENGERINLYFSTFAGQKSKQTLVVNGQSLQK